MRRFARQTTAFSILAAALLCLAGQRSAFARKAEAKPVWMTDLAKAVKRAKKENRLLLIHFYADWCGPCQKMQQETLTSRALAAQLAGNIVAVKINTDKHPEILKQYGIRALPTDVFVAPTGQILSRNEGYQSQRDYLALVARIDASFDNTERIRIAKLNGAKKSGGNGKTATPPHNPSAKPLIGMDGYSPVALFNSRQWRPGKREFAWKYQDVTFWMADATELADFKADPRKYAPRLLGCDPVLLNETDRAIQGKIAYGAFFDGFLYFFVSDESRIKFRGNPLPYTRTRHVLRVEHIGGTVRR